MEFNLLSTSTADTDTFFVITKIVSGVPADYKIPISNLVAYVGALPVVANNDVLAQTGALTSVTSYTPVNTGTFQISTYLNVVSITGYTVNVLINFTDENNASQTLPICGTTIVEYVSTARFINCRAKGGTVINVYTTLTSSGSISYDCGASIIQLS